MFWHEDMVTNGLLAWVSTFWHNTGMWQTDGRTDGWNCRS